LALWRIPILVVLLTAQRRRWVAVNVGVVAVAIVRRTVTVIRIIGIAVIIRVTPAAQAKVKAGTPASIVTPASVIAASEATTHVASASETTTHVASAAESATSGNSAAKSSASYRVSAPATTTMPATVLGVSRRK